MENVRGLGNGFLYKVFKDVVGPNGALVMARARHLGQRHHHWWVD